jgi:BMFP domain-containing protein YqiC
MTQKDPAQFLVEMQDRILALIRSGPAGDLERNLKALVEQTFERMDLVTRSALEIERERLNRLQQRVAALEARLGEHTGDTAHER